MARKQNRGRDLGQMLAGLFLLCGMSASGAQGATNPVPFINQPLVPGAVAPGAAGFTLTVNGTGFVSGSAVNWNGSARATTFVSSSRLTAAILASDIAAASTASVTVTSPGPGGGTSNGAFFEIVTPVSPLRFGVTTAYPTGRGPVSATSGDFNGDGNPDLAIVNQVDDTVSVFLSNGDGTFQPQVAYATGFIPLAVITADLNSDGKLDLVVCNEGANTVSVLLGNGDGSFQAHADYATGSAPAAAAAADLNGDGKLDLVTANESGGTVSVLLGNGDGTFQTQAQYAADVPPASVVVGDFNGDGRLDLAAVSSSLGLVEVLLGNGDGSFQAPRTTIVNFTPTAITAADFNGDGILDLAMNSFQANLVEVLLGKGDGTFQTVRCYSTGPGPISIATADVDGNGILDLVTAASGSISVLLGKGDGSFQSPVSITSNGTNGLVASDFNRDGNVDFATVNENLYTVSVLLRTTGPLVTLSPTSLTFSTQLVGTVSGKQASTLSNTGNLDLSISSVTISSNFVQKNTCGASLPVGASCSIMAQFKPTKKGSLAGTVSIADNAPGSPQQISLAGTGTVVKISPTSLNFGNVPVGTTSSPQIVTLTNVSISSALNIGRIAFSGHDAGYFAQTNTCGTSVPPNTSCTLSVTFTPKAKVATGATLNIFDNGGASPQTVALSGTGT